MSPRVFLSYRRHDVPRDAEHLCRRLQGRCRPFLDLNAHMVVGAPFPERLRKEVRKADVFLALIGKRWLELLHAHPRDADDYVIEEIATALESKTHWVVPVLFDGAILPQKAEVPERIRALLDLEAAHVPPMRKAKPCPRGCRLEHLVDQIIYWRWAERVECDVRGSWAKMRDLDVHVRRIPAGTFVMGAPENECGSHRNERPMHEVELTRDFFLGETPCMQALWIRLMGENPSRFRADMPDQRPVERIDYADMRVFLDQLSGC